VVAVRRVLVGVQVFLIIAASFTILSNAEVGSWTPDFRLKVQARTDKLASIRAENLLLQQVPPAVHDSAGSIRNTYGTALTLIENNSSNMRPLSGGAGSPTNVSVLAVLAEKRGFPSHILEMSDTKPVRAEAILRDEQQKASASVVRTLDRQIAAETRRTSLLREQAVQAFVDVLVPIPVGGAIAREFAKAAVVDVMNAGFTAVSGRVDAVALRARLNIFLQNPKSSSVGLAQTISGKVTALVAEKKYGEFRDAFLKGVKGGWAVTENPDISRKLFIYKSESGNQPANQLYQVTVGEDGSWTVYNWGASKPEGTISPSDIPQVSIVIKGDERYDQFRRTFLKGIEKGWVVTENPSISNRLFVHESESDNQLVNPLYQIKVGQDGSWTVYNWGESAPQGRIVSREVPNVSIGACDCEE